MKRIYLVLTLFVFSIISMFIGVFIVGLTNASVVCNKDEYDAGGYCRVKPTGCPYGDSIPKGKCESPVQKKKNTISKDNHFSPKKKVKSVKEIKPCE